MKLSKLPDFYITPAFIAPFKGDPVGISEHSLVL